MDRALSWLLDTWADALNRHATQRISGLVTPDALLQGFDPVPGYGQPYIAADYRTAG